jgi:hypothetical protein
MQGSGLHELQRRLLHKAGAHPGGLGVRESTGVDVDMQCRLFCLVNLFAMDAFQERVGGGRASLLSFFVAARPGFEFVVCSGRE